MSSHPPPPPPPPPPPESPGVVRRRRAEIMDTDDHDDYDDDDPGGVLFLQESWRSFTNMAILPLLARSAGDERRRLLSIYARWEQVVKMCQRRALRTRLLQFRAQYRILLVYQQYCDYRIKLMHNFVEAQVEELVFRSLSRAILSKGRNILVPIHASNITFFSRRHRSAHRAVCLYVGVNGRKLGFAMILD